MYWTLSDFALIIFQLQALEHLYIFYLHLFTHFTTKDKPYDCIYFYLYSNSMYCNILTLLLLHAPDIIYLY